MWNAICWAALISFTPSAVNNNYVSSVKLVCVHTDLSNFSVLRYWGGSLRNCAVVSTRLHRSIRSRLVPVQRVTWWRFVSGARLVQTHELLMDLQCNDVCIRLDGARWSAERDEDGWRSGLMCNFGLVCQDKTLCVFPRDAKGKL